MPADCAYDYAIVRVVPRVERGEMINVGIILSCPDSDFIAARVDIDDTRLLALDPSLDLDLIRQHLASIPAICEGRPDAGPIAALPARQRFYWLVSPRSTVIQVSPVHTGRTADPIEALERLMDRMVRVPRGDSGAGRPHSPPPR